MNLQHGLQITPNWWFGFGFEPVVLAEGDWETITPIGGKLTCRQVSLKPSGLVSRTPCEDTSEGVHLKTAQYSMGSKVLQEKGSQVFLVS